MVICLTFEVGLFIVKLVIACIQPGLCFQQSPDQNSSPPRINEQTMPFSSDLWIVYNTILRNDMKCKCHLICILPDQSHKTLISRLIHYAYNNNLCKNIDSTNEKKFITLTYMYDSNKKMHKVMRSRIVLGLVTKIHPYHMLRHFCSLYMDSC